ncbi:hypothetical protein SAMN05444392_10765 [Seinonella peptonophila]|uniref:Nucleoid associated protein NdpA n=1 Tax=Seinonella peptonophila TaxID=112248 RepID=A0A1M4YP96_9BACL|nr:nucleoid-associated protein [Seinonella peptonophila]SHF07483.1 hypothetical protein SAMN05444392_10765 [Seinonella peptonophila]
MLDFTELKLENLVIHKVGNRMRNEKLIIADSVQDSIDNDTKDVLLKYLLSPFRKKEPIYKFTHETNIKLNEVYAYTKEIFDDPDKFHGCSVNILKHLYSVSTHPQIKSGEFYMVYFKDCIVDKQKVDTIGIFKTENKDIYLKVNERYNEFTLGYEKGININKLDKGCLIFNIGSSIGFQVSVVDNSNAKEAQYWKDEFLKLDYIQNSDFKTNHFISMFNEYCNNGHVNNLEKKEKIIMRNKGLQYLMENDHFDIEDFKTEVIKKQDEVEGFDNFRKNYYEEERISIDDSFIVTQNTVQKMRKKVDNKINLDDGVEIRISNAEPELIEKGYDERKQMWFYKLFYKNEE